MSVERCKNCPNDLAFATIRRVAGVVRQHESSGTDLCPGPRVIETLQAKVFSRVPVVIHRRETCGLESIESQIRHDEKPETVQVLTGVDGRQVVEVMARFFFSKPAGRY